MRDGDGHPTAGWRSTVRSVGRAVSRKFDDAHNSDGYIRHAWVWGRRFYSSACGGFYRSRGRANPVGLSVHVFRDPTESWKQWARQTSGNGGSAATATSHHRIGDHSCLVSCFCSSHSRTHHQRHRRATTTAMTCGTMKVTHCMCTVAAAIQTVHTVTCDALVNVVALYV